VATFAPSTQGAALRTAPGPGQVGGHHGGHRLDPRVIGTGRGEQALQRRSERGGERALVEIDRVLAVIGRAQRVVERARRCRVVFQHHSCVQIEGLFGRQRCRCGGGPQQRQAQQQRGGQYVAGIHDDQRPMQGAEA